MSDQIQNPTQQTVTTNATNTTPDGALNATNTTAAVGQLTTNTAPVFDPSTLSPEALAWVDRQRTQASQTARANAKKELMKDQNFLNQVRQGMVQEVQTTVETGMEEKINALMLRTATSEVSRILENAGIPREQMQTYIDLFVSNDIDGSIEKATNFVSAFTTSLQSLKDAQQKHDIVNMTTPQTARATVSEQQALQARLDEARKEQSWRSRDVRIAAIMREASEKGITLK